MCFMKKCFPNLFTRFPNILNILYVMLIYNAFTFHHNDWLYEIKNFLLKINFDIFHIINIDI